MPVMDPVDGSYRTTRTLVAGIIEVDGGVAPTDAAMEPYILLANEFVTEACTGANGPATDYSDQRLELIERWLAAHLYTVRDPRAESEKAGSVSAKYQSAVAIGFDSSHYGQTAIRIDTNGGLAAINERAKRGTSKVGIAWLGTAKE